jgi:hypothetical protein
MKNWRKITNFLSQKVVVYSKVMENLRKTPTFCLKGHRKFEINKFHTDESWKIEGKLQTFSLKSHWDFQKKNLSQESENFEKTE